MTTLNELPIGKQATIFHVGGEGALRQHFLDMGLIPGARIVMERYAPLGDPVMVRIQSYDLTLRLDEAKLITIDQICDPEQSKSTTMYRPEIAHPGLGEGGKYHYKKTETPLPKGTTLTFALAGNQNSGKTSLFNQLTGSGQHVGNFPGVTVSRKDGVIKGIPNTMITDLPGIYSLSPYSQEEIITRDFLINEDVRGIINIVDATNIERNLYLTMQLIELDIPMVVALNMMDVVKDEGGTILINALEARLGVPVVPISAAKNEGIRELVAHAVHVAYYQERPKRQDFCLADARGGAVHRCLHGIMCLIEDKAKESGLTPRFAASKLAEGDLLVSAALDIDQNEKETIEHIIIQMEHDRGLDRNAAIAEMRFNFINRVCADTVIKPQKSKEHERSLKIDKMLTGKWTAIPAFILIMALVFFLTFNVIGAQLSKWLEVGITALTDLTAQGLSAVNVHPVLQSLIIDGVFNGVGSVLSFLPTIVVLFFFLSMLEDSGYMARIAFVMDKLLRKLGLSGRSIVPMLIGFGCTVPGVMACRTISSERDRKMTILLTPFMSCSAKIPIYAFFTAAFFPGKGALVMTGLYFIGIIVAILLALVMKKWLFKGEAVPFVMELPNYRFPGLKNVGMLLWEKVKDFLQRAFTVIFIASLVIWFLQTFSLNFNIVTDSSTSILAAIAGVISPIFIPLGFNDWRISTALITGFMAKESVVSTLSVLFGSQTAFAAVMTLPAVLALCVFCLLYTPCVAAVSAIRREMGTKWAIGVVIGQCVIAWIVGAVVFAVAGVFL